MWYRDYYPRYPRSTPRKARGGIKAQSKRGDFGESWWAKRWIAVLEGFDIGARLGRGRSYARSGQVLSVDVEPARVKAKVQGSRPQPYDITIKVKALTAQEWDRVLASLGGQALYAARLLAGEMPQDIETVFADAGVSLFPGRRADLETDCSCPDWSNPCKHIAAVYYLLGEEFDRDPFLIFKLRGLPREELFSRLGQARRPAQEARPESGPEVEGKGTKKVRTKTGKKALKKAEPTASALEAELAQALPEPADAPVQKGVVEARAEEAQREPLPAGPQAFWAQGELPADLFGDVARPPVAAGWPKRLGNFPFWRGEERFLDAMEQAYREAGRHGLAVFQGEAELPAGEPTAVKRGR